MSLQVIVLRISNGIRNGHQRWGKKHGIKLKIIKFHLGMLKISFFFSFCVCVCVKTEKEYIKILTSANSKTRDIFSLLYFFSAFLNLP